MLRSPTIRWHTRYEFMNAIKKAKKDYRDKLHDHISSTKSRDLWQGLNKITGYKPKSKPLPDDDVTLPDKLNEFYCRFDRPVNEAPPNGDLPEQALTLTEADTRKVLSELNIRKAAGPDGISPRHLRECCNELCAILTLIFNWSLNICQVPRIFKASTIIPVPKRSPVSSLNDYRPVALTSIIMKSFERLVLNYLKSILPKSLDPSQFAYRTNRSVEDAVSLTLHYVLKHLDLRTSTYARLLFIDFSSFWRVTMFLLK